MFPDKVPFKGAESTEMYESLDLLSKTILLSSHVIPSKKVGVHKSNVPILLECLVPIGYSTNGRSIYSGLLTMIISCSSKSPDQSKEMARFLMDSLSWTYSE